MDSGPAPGGASRNDGCQFVILYPVALTIGCQNAVLAASSALRPSGVVPTGIRPIASSFSFTSGLASAAPAAALNWRANSGGVPAGRHSPTPPRAPNDPP